MAHKRNIDESKDIKFELLKNEKCTLFAVVTKFNKNSYIHIRKYYNDLPTKYGICFREKEWYEFVSFVHSELERKTMEKIDIRKHTNGDYHLKSRQKDFTLYIRKDTIESLKNRYVKIIPSPKYILKIYNMINYRLA